jgi:hypothetical protein
MTIKALYPTINPTLNLDFANTKTLGPLVTFTRASSATYVGSDGLIKTAAVNEPRFDHNPTTGESLGLLVEEQRTNSFLQSQDFSTSWSNVGSSENTNVSVAPDGTQTADALVDTAINETHNFTQNLSGLAGSTTHTFSCFMKKGSTNYGVLGFAPNSSWGIGTGASVFFDLNNGTVGTASNATGTIQALPNGWYRCTATATTVATPGTATMRIGSSLTGTAQTYTGAGDEAIYTWGAQLEAGAFATSYIPTTTAAATRNADVANITGTNFSSWYRQDEGTVFAEWKCDPSTGSHWPNPAYFDDGTNNNYIGLQYRLPGAKTIRLNVVSGGVSSVSTTTNAYTPGQSGKTAAAFKANDFGVVLAGSTVATSATGSMPLVTTARIGFETVSSSYFNGTIKRITFWPQRLANSTLQAITQ